MPRIFNEVIFLLVDWHLNIEYSNIVSSSSFLVYISLVAVLSQELFLCPAFLCLTLCLHGLEFSHQFKGITMQISGVLSLYDFFLSGTLPHKYQLYIYYIHTYTYIYSINPIFILLIKINTNFPVKKIFGLFATNSFPAETLKNIFFSEGQLNVVPGEKILLI